MGILERWLAEHDGEPPMLEIHMGGYVGFDASDLERLSGFLTTINQQDGKRCKNSKKGCKISDKKAAELERVCSPYGLRWRKERNLATDTPLENPRTFIQDASKRFQEYYAKHGTEGEFIQKYFYGYPKKHQKQEHLDVVGKGITPPSRTKLKKEEKKNAEAAAATAIKRATTAVAKRAGIRRAVIAAVTRPSP
jgi:hypothetical protein